jgi:hypothetical protein
MESMSTVRESADAPTPLDTGALRVSIAVDDTRKTRTLNVKAAVDNLSFYYGEHRALKNLTIPIPGRRRRRSDRSAHAHRHGVPEAESVPEIDFRERRLRFAAAGAA